MKRKKARQMAIIRNISIFSIVCLIVLLGIVLGIKKYAPTKERMELSEYYKLQYEDEAAVILNGKYDPDADREGPEAVLINDMPFLEISFLKSNLDDGYVYDKEEGILRYVTDVDVITAKKGELMYTKGRDSVDFNGDIILDRDTGTFINIAFVEQFTDIKHVIGKDPARVAIESANTEIATATIKKDTPLRRFGGPKSKIVFDGKKGQTVSVIEDYGKWSQIVTEDGVVGCVKNNSLSKIETRIAEKRLPDRVYRTHLLDKKVSMVWHQVYGASSTKSLSGLLSRSTGVNVICPTWYRISDNQGNISKGSVAEYVNTCHNAGIQVWGMLSNFEVEGIDTTAVLNRTSSRDNLVNSVVAAAIADNLDGINIDFEALSIDAKDGFIEFIRELSLRCDNNDLILSVDNYKPAAHTTFYNRTEQAKYADYVILMAYDEYHGASEEPGSNSSLPFVKQAVEDTLTEVPANQLILGLPFYTRVWSTDGSSWSNKAMGMGESNKLAENTGAEKVWLPNEEQYFLKYEEGGRSYQVWLEDEESYSRKLGIYKEKGLAGAAFWKAGMETSSIWGVISGYIN